MATTAVDLPDDGPERRAYVHEQLGNWLQRKFRGDRTAVTVDEAADVLDLPEPDVRRALDDLVDDDVTPLEREDDRYELDAE
jgi:DNA-binding IclR family transcriptional regulator